MVFSSRTWTSAGTPPGVELRAIDSASSNPLSEYFTLDSAGNIAGLTERTSAGATATRTFTYDGLDRLTAQKNGATSVEGFSYDATGNRLSKTAGTTTAYSYPAGSHRLSSVGSIGRTYNATGETLTIGSGGNARQSTYDLRHRLATYSVNNTLRMTYLYNALGQRVAKQSVQNGGSFQFVYDESGHLLGEYSTTGVRIKEYVWLDDTLVAVLGAFDGKDYHFVETDHLGTPRAIVHPSKNTIEWRWDVNPTSFGEHAPNGNPDGDGLTYTLNLRFPGQYYDLESGFNYNYFRDYDTGTGRYLESDPIGLRGGLSTFGYAGQTPLGAVDFYGLNSWKGQIVGAQGGYSRLGYGVTFQHFTLNLEMPIGMCDFYGKRYRVRMQSSKERIWGKAPPDFRIIGSVSFDDGNQAFEPGALTGPFSLDVAQGSISGMLRMGPNNRVAQVFLAQAPTEGNFHMDGTLSYFSRSWADTVHGYEERQCDCDKPVAPSFLPNTSWRDLDK